MVEVSSCCFLWAQNIFSRIHFSDEVSAIVVDVGYTNCKAGFAGEDNPKAVFPSVRNSISYKVPLLYAFHHNPPISSL